MVATQARDGVSEVTDDDWSVGYTVGAMLEYLTPNDISFLQIAPTPLSSKDASGYRK